MNRIIKVIRLSTPEEAKKSIKFFVDQLEKNGICYIKNDYHIPACRLFARFCSDFKPKILVTPGDGKFVKNIISIDPDFRIERIGEYAFRLKNKF